MRVEAGRGFIRGADRAACPCLLCPVSAHLGPGVNEADPILVDGNQEDLREVWLRSLLEKKVKNHQVGTQSRKSCVHLGQNKDAPAGIELTSPANSVPGGRVLAALPCHLDKSSHRLPSESLACLQICFPPG